MRGPPGDELGNYTATLLHHLCAIQVSRYLILDFGIFAVSVGGDGVLCIFL